MKTFSQFCVEAYDKEVMSGSQIRTMGSGGRLSAERKKSPAEMRRTKRTGGGESKPSSYKPRADVGTQRATSSRVQAPTQELGSAEVKKAYAEKVKAERRAAAKARAAGVATTKSTAKELEKQASKLLSTKAADKPKTTTPASDERFASSKKPEDHKIKGKYTRAEKKQVVRAGKQKLRDLVLAATGKKTEKELQHKYTGSDS